MKGFMFSTIDLNSLSLYREETDVVASIDKSLQSRQISRLKPAFLSQPRPQTSSNVRRNSTQKIKIVPELRAAVDVLKTRLSEKPDLKMIPRPSTRLKFFTPNEGISPGKYHTKNNSTGGFEFTKTPRMQESIDHKLKCVSNISALTPKKEKKIDYEIKNIHTAINITDYYTSIKNRTKNHNQKVFRNTQIARVLKFQKKEQRKSEYLYKTEKFHWREMHGPEILVAKKKWIHILVCYTISYTMRFKIQYRKLAKKKTFNALNFIRIFSKALGKFLRVLQRKRKFLKYKNVRVYVTPIQTYIEKEQRAFCREVSKFAWKITNEKHFIRLFFFWRLSLKTLQIHAKNFIQIRKARILVLTKIFNKLISETAKPEHRRVSYTMVSSQKNQPPNRQKLISDYISFYTARHIALKTPFQLYSDRKSQTEFMMRALKLNKRPPSALN